MSTVSWDAIDKYPVAFQWELAGADLEVRELSRSSFIDRLLARRRARTTLGQVVEFLVQRVAAGALDSWTFDDLYRLRALLTLSEALAQGTLAVDHKRAWSAPRNDVRPGASVLSAFDDAILARRGLVPGSIDDHASAPFEIFLDRSASDVDFLRRDRLRGIFHAVVAAVDIAVPERVSPRAGIRVADRVFEDLLRYAGAASAWRDDDRPTWDALGVSAPDLIETLVRGVSQWHRPIVERSYSFHGTTLASLRRLTAFGYSEESRGYPPDAARAGRDALDDDTPVYIHRPPSEDGFFFTTGAALAVDYASDAPEWIVGLRRGASPLLHRPDVAAHIRDVESIADKGLLAVRRADVCSLGALVDPSLRLLDACPPIAALRADAKIRRVLEFLDWHAAHKLGGFVAYRHLYADRVQAVRLPPNMRIRDSNSFSAPRDGVAAVIAGALDRVRHELSIDHRG